MTAEALAANLTGLEQQIYTAKTNADSKEAKFGPSDPQTIALWQRVEALRRVRDDLLGRAES